MKGQKPSIGRMVRYVTTDKGEKTEIPAVVTKVIAGDEHQSVNLHLLWDPEIVRFHTMDKLGVNVPYDERGTLIGTWHWPERD